jgi:hypothetical protein
MKTIAVIAFTLAATSVFASADLTITASTSQTLIRAGYTYSGLSFMVRNNGPDAARNVTLTVTAPFAVPCPCSLGDLPAGQSVTRVMQFMPPGPSGTVTLTASVSSDAPDPSPADNSVSQAMTVSTDPDLSLSVQAPQRQDLTQPFTLSLFITNYSISDAHDVDVTFNFRPDVSVLSLPAGCSDLGAGRVVCHLDVIPGEPPFTTGPRFTMKLVAPAAYGSGTIAVTATATEREHDFDPASNTATSTTNLIDAFHVTTTADSGQGSLRQAILDANANCRGGTTLCAIDFAIAEATPTPWKTIRVTSPLPEITAPSLRIDGASQTRFSGDTNPGGPEIEISGGGTVDGDGLLIAACSEEVANLSIGGFLRNGISVTTSVLPCVGSSTAELHDLFLGTDPTGKVSRPNARGIGTSVPNGTSFFTAGTATNITHCVISGNVHSGIFGMSGRLNIKNSRIGVRADADVPLPNGNSGVFIGAGGFGSVVGADYLDEGSPTAGNVIAFNGETGLAVATAAKEVSFLNNRIWGNRLLGIDIGLDGPTQAASSSLGYPVAIPVLTLAHYDPVSNKTIVEGEIPPPPAFNHTINIFANDAPPDSSGYGQGQRVLGIVAVDFSHTHFHFEAAGDLTGTWISATNTSVTYIGFAKPAGIEQGFLTLTSEFSRWLEVR